MAFRRLVPLRLSAKSYRLGLLLRLLSARLWWLRSWSALLLLRLSLLSTCLRWLRLLALRAPLLGVWRRALLLPALMIFTLALSFVLLVVLRVRRDKGSEEQEQGGTGNSNILHRLTPLTNR